MITVLHVLPSLDPEAGGISQAVRSIIGYASDKDVRHEAVCLDHAGAGFLRGYDFVIHALGNKITAWNYSSKLKSWLNLNLSSYDTIIVHGLWQYQGYAVYKSWKRVKKDIVLYVMPHGMLDPYFQRAKERSLKAVRNLLFWELTERQLLNNADAVLFTCEEEEALARNTFRAYRPGKTCIVGLGVKKPPLFSGQIPVMFRNSGPGIADKSYWLFLGRIHPKKGVDLLIKSYLKLKSQGVSLPLLVIAGPGLHTDFGKQMLKLSERDPEILFPGMLEGQSKWDAFYGCEAFVLPSHQENFGIAVAEALACGKPVLISDQVNIWREIEADSAGMVASDTLAGTHELLKSWQLLSDQEKQNYAHNAKLCYERRYSEDVAAKALLEIIKRLIIK